MTMKRIGKTMLGSLLAPSREYRRCFAGTEQRLPLGAGRASL